MEPYCKTFTVEEHQVVAMMRGAGETDGHSKLELSTEVDGIFVRITLELPSDAIQEKFNQFDEESALATLNAANNMLGDEQA